MTPIIYSGVGDMSVIDVLTAIDDMLRYRMLMKIYLIIPEH